MHYIDAFCEPFWNMVAMAKYEMATVLKHRVECRFEDGKGEAMTEENLRMLLEVAKKIEPTAEQRESQRRSFAFGNTAFENRLITREMIDRQAEELAQAANEPSKR
jgi:hypothetical protein